MAVGLALGAIAKVSSNLLGDGLKKLKEKRQEKKEAKEEKKEAKEKAKNAEKSKDASMMKLKAFWDKHQVKIYIGLGIILFVFFIWPMFLKPLFKKAQGRSSSPRRRPVSRTVTRRKTRKR